jgi:GNAT superfamily N-acetyltransferase
MDDTLRISNDPAELDRDVIHDMMSRQSAWARGIPRETMDRAIDNSLCFGGYLGKSQVAFARVVTDFATFANLVDVFVLPEHRGKGYAKALVAAVVTHPRLQGLRRFTLHTTDAHGLYAQFGFTPSAKPEHAMERWFPGLYVKEKPSGQ